MNWTHVLLAGYVGAVIAAVIGLMRKKGWVGKASGAVLMVVAIVAWNLFDVHYLIPREKAASGQTEEQQFDAALLQMPTFQVLKEQEPAFWVHLRTQALQLKNEGKTEQQIIDTIQPQVLQIQMSRLQQAPDSNVIDYMKTISNRLRRCRKKATMSVSAFLFPPGQRRH